MTTKIHIMHTGAVNIDRALAFREKTWHPAPYTGWFRPKSKRIRVPVSSYLIEHPNGLVLIDTGWSNAIRYEQKKHVGNLSYSMFKGELPEGKAIHEQLKAKGISEKDLDVVVLTHLHADHVSGLHHVKNAKEIIVNELEWAQANKELGYIPSMWEGINITPFNLQEIPYGPYRAGLDLFGDGTVYLIHTPGHSKGQLSVMALISSGWVLLASDVGYSAESWEKGILPGITTDKKQALDSLEWVKYFADSEECVTALANHDPSVSEGIIR